MYDVHSGIRMSTHVEQGSTYSNCFSGETSTLSLHPRSHQPTNQHILIIILITASLTFVTGTYSILFVAYVNIGYSVSGQKAVNM